MFDSMNNYIQNFEKFQVYYKKSGARNLSARPMLARHAMSPSLAIRVQFEFDSFVNELLSRPIIGVAAIAIC